MYHCWLTDQENPADGLDIECFDEWTAASRYMRVKYIVTSPLLFPCT